MAPGSVTEAVRHHLYLKLAGVLLGVLSVAVLWGRAEVLLLVKAVGLFVAVEALRLLARWNRPAAVQSEEWERVEDGERAAWEGKRVERREILAELLSLVILPAGGLLWWLMVSRPVVRLDGVERWPVLLVVAGCLAAHYLPGWRGGRAARLRVATATMVAGVVGFMILDQHAYLLMRGEARQERMAHRVLAERNVVQAGSNVDVVFAYAEMLANRGLVPEAAEWYAQGLALAPFDGAARQRWLELSGGSRTVMPEPASRAAEPGVPERRELPLQREVPAHRFAICLVPMGDVPDALIHAAGARVRDSLDVEVCRFERTLELPKPDRRNGLLGGVQWGAPLLFKTFVEQGEPFIPSAHQYVVVSSGDIYLPGSNFVFGTAVGTPGGIGNGIVSYSRFKANGASWDQVVDRLSKQLVSTSIKALGVPASSDAACVTAYCRDLAEFDLKSARPATDSERWYRAQIRSCEEQIGPLLSR